MTGSWAGEPTPSLTPYGVAELVKERLLVQFVEHGIIPPTRQLVYFSPIPADCEQLAVLIGTVNLSPFPSDGMFVCLPGRWAVNIGVVITRKTCAIAKGTAAPTIASMQQAAQIASADCDMLMDFVSTFSEVGTVELTMHSPNGGLQTVELNIQLPITGNF